MPCSESGIAICGLLVLIGTAADRSHLYFGAQHGFPPACCSADSSAPCACCPDHPHGASLPAIVRFIESTPEGVFLVGIIYTAQHRRRGSSAVSSRAFTCCRIYDTVVATFVAVLINIAVAVAGFALARLAPFEKRDVWLSPDIFHQLDHLRRHRHLRRLRARRRKWSDPPAGHAAPAPPSTFSAIILAVFLIGPGHRQRPRIHAGHLLSRFCARHD